MLFIHPLFRNLIQSCFDGLLMTKHVLHGLTAGFLRTVIWVSPCFGYPHTQIPSEMGIPGRDTQNTDKRLEEARSFCRLSPLFNTDVFVIDFGVMSGNIIESKVILDIKSGFFMPLIDCQPPFFIMNCTIANGTAGFKTNARDAAIVSVQVEASPNNS